VPLSASLDERVVLFFMKTIEVIEKLREKISNKPLFAVQNFDFHDLH